MSIFQSNLEVSLFGESHGRYIGITIANLPSNIELDIGKIKADLHKRTAFKIAKSKRNEADEFEIISGVFNNKTTGAPLTFLINNRDVDSSVYEKNKGIARPSHSDYSAHIKYKGANDYRGGGHLSGRLTALLIILGSICESELIKQDIQVASRIKSIYDIDDTSEVVDFNNLKSNFPVNDPDIKVEMINFLKELENDSVGGVVETYVKGVKAGIGKPIFAKAESHISRLIFSIPGIKGIEFGAGFNLAKLLGSQANDQMKYVDGKVKFLSNNSGGIQGGITNGENIVFRTVVKPTPSINIPLQTIDYLNKKNIILSTKGRHDASFVPKVVHVINAVTAFAIYDLILGEYNG